MPAADQGMLYRPLRGGISIVNPIANKVGTLGFIAEDKSTGDLWIVSCFHIIARPHKPNVSALQTGESIFQPRPQQGGTEIARTDVQRVAQKKKTHDFAAAKIIAGVGAVSDILGLGRPEAKPKPPEKGLAVLKAGAKTGLTEGVIKSVSGDTVRIEPPGDFPDGYSLSEPGDSGALWVEKASHRPVALHRKGNRSGREFALATDINVVLSQLGLDVFVGQQ